MNKKVIVICGPTASGKSDISIQIAKKFNAEIISADSMQIYKHMDIGTAKLKPENRQGIKHHLIDIVDIKKPFSVAEYQKIARQKIEEISSKGKMPLIVGGTGLYIRAVIDDLRFPAGKIEDETRNRLEEELNKKGIDYLYEKIITIDPDAVSFIDKDNPRRIIRALEVQELTGKPFSSYRQDFSKIKQIYPAILIGLEVERATLYDKINLRVENMFKEGFLDETKKLIKLSLKDSLVSMQAIGYKEIIDYIDGRIGLIEAKENIKKRTRRYAKRQFTWFKKDPRIKWVNSKNKNVAIKKIIELIS